MAQAAARYGDHAPTAAVCCNACRTCAATNIVGLVLAGAGGLALGVNRLMRRLGQRG